ncbi:hypothetical protein [Novosphingobium panipatense]|uniref:hypothetical protein n=1 Tax=Novosphingobium panipatense TaxID=428991 RepID=UPI003614E8EE
MNQSIVLAPPPGQIAPTAGTRVPHTTADRVDAGALIAFLRRRWPLMLALTLGSLAAGFVISARQTPTYLSTADVTLDPKVAPVAPLTDEDRLAAQGAMGETWIDTQVEEMASSRNVAAVVKRLDLARDPAFWSRALRKSKHETPRSHTWKAE